jgi:hypothetical protein
MLRKPIQLALVLLLVAGSAGPLRAQIFGGADADEFDLNEFAEDWVKKGMSIEKVAHVQNVTIERDAATYELVDGYFLLQEPMKGEVFRAYFTGVAKVRIEPPVPIERKQMERYWGEETMETDLTSVMFVFNADEDQAFFQGFDYRPTEEVEKEIEAEEDAEKEKKGDAAEDEEQDEEAAEAEANRKKAQGRLKAALEATRKAKEEELDEKALHKQKMERWGMQIEGIAKLTSNLTDYFFARAKRDVPPEEAKSGKVVIRGVNYEENPYGLGGGEEISVSFQTDWGTQQVGAYHYKDEYDPKLAYVPTSEIIENEDRRPYNIPAVKVVGNLAKNKQDLSANAIFQLVSQHDGLRVVLFTLAPSLKIHSLELLAEDGTTVPLQLYRLPITLQEKNYSYICTTLLPEPLNAGEEARIRVSYEGEAAERIESGFYAMGKSRFNWLPGMPGGLTQTAVDFTLFSPQGTTVTATGNPGACSEEIITEVTTKTRPAQAVAASGDGGTHRSGLEEVVVVTARSDYKCERWQATDPPVWLPTWNVAENVKVDRTHLPDGRPITVLAHQTASTRFGFRDDLGQVHYHDYQLAKGSSTVRAAANAAVQVYEDKFAPYPYKKLDLVPWEIGNPLGLGWVAQAPPTLITMPYAAYLSATAQNQIFQELEEATGRPFTAGFTPWTWYETTAHETAHQWWGHIIGMRTMRDHWISEGGANFSCVLVMEEYDRANGTDYVDRIWEERLESLVRKDGLCDSLAPVSLGGSRIESRFDPEGCGGNGFRIIYNKGSYVWQNLRTLYRAMAFHKFPNENPMEKGDELFFGMMKSFFAKHGFQATSTYDVEKHVSGHLGDMSWFFKQWLYGTGIPDLKLAWGMAAEGGKIDVRIVQTNTDFQFPVLLTVRTKGGRKGPVKVANYYLMVGSKDYSVAVPVEGTPSEVTLNEDHGTLLTWKHVPGSPDSLKVKDLAANLPAPE